MTTQPELFGGPPRGEQQPGADAAPAVFVDAMLPCLRNARWPYDENCHLFVAAGTPLEVLHAFAAELGLRRAWFQAGDRSMPHYDLTRNKRREAVRRGAVEASRSVTVAHIRGWKDARG